MVIQTFLLKILRPVMVAGKMIEVGQEIELVEREAIKLVEAGKAEFAALEEKIEKALGFGEGASAANADAPPVTAQTADPAAAPAPAAPAATPAAPEEAAQ